MRFKIISFLFLTVFIVSALTLEGATRYAVTEIDLSSWVENTEWDYSTSRLNDQGTLLFQVPSNEGGVINVIWDQISGAQRLDMFIPDLDEAMEINQSGTIMGVLKNGSPFLWNREEGLSVIDLPMRMQGVPRLNNSNQVLLLLVSPSAIAIAITTDGKKVPTVCHDEDYFIWDKEKGFVPVSLPDGQKATHLYPIDFNGKGQILFWELQSAEFFNLFNSRNSFYVWENGKGKIFSDQFPNTAFCLGLNNLGDLLAIYSEDGMNGIGFLISAEGERFVIQQDHVSLEVKKMNDRREVVGTKHVRDENLPKRDPRAFFWSPVEGIIDLNDVVASADWVLEEAITINNRGQILTLAKTKENKDIFLLLTPEN